MERHPAVSTYIERLDSPQREICERLRELLGTQEPPLREGFKWSRPVYSVDDGDVCYIVALKHHVDLGFNDGVDLDDPDGLLQGTGKRMRHIKLHSPDDIDTGYITTLVARAVVIRTG